MRHPLIVLLLALLPVGAFAQSAPAPADAAAAELVKLNATLKEIATALSRQSDLQSVDLLLKRVQLSESQAADLERRLQSAQAERNSLENERRNTEMRLKMFTSRLEKGVEVASAEIEAMTTQMEGELKRIRQRVGQLTPEIDAVESELATRRDEVRSWLSVLDRRLSKYQ